MKKIKEIKQPTHDDAKEKIIVALDSFSKIKALTVVKMLKDHVGMFKVGLQLFSSCGPDIIKEIKDLGGKVFLDLKLFDIPTTVRNTAQSITSLGVEMFTVHALGGSKMMSEAYLGANAKAFELCIERPKIIAVTILSSMSQFDIQKELNISISLKKMVAKLTSLAHMSFADGVVTSPHESKELKNIYNDEMLIITPGIRPCWAQTNDQKRFMTPKEAIKNKADYLVIGRPISSPPEDVTEIEAANIIGADIFSAMTDLLKQGEKNAKNKY